MVRTVTATSEHAGERLDSFLASALEISRSAAARLTEEGRITAGGKVLGKNYRLLGGEELTAEIPEPEDTEIRAQDIPLDVVYEDDDVIVVNKPA